VSRPAFEPLSWRELPPETMRRRSRGFYVDESVGIATGLLVAALHLAGLATLTHTPSPMGFLRGILGRPGNERPFLLRVAGYPAPDARVPAIQRKPSDEIAGFLDGP
jgi:hypothetical protein